MKSNYKISRKLLFSVFLLLLYSCTNMNSKRQKNVFLSQFSNNESIYNSLSDYYRDEKIIIYDENKVLVDKGVILGSEVKKIEFVTVKPTNDKYFIVHNFILNRNLATVILASSDRESGIIYYLKRNDINEEWKSINIIPKNNR